MTRHSLQVGVPPGSAASHPPGSPQIQEQQLRSSQWLGLKASAMGRHQRLECAPRPSSVGLWPVPQLQVTPQPGVVSVTASAPGSSEIIPIRRTVLSRYDPFTATGFPLSEKRQKPPSKLTHHLCPRHGVNLNGRSQAMTTQGAATLYPRWASETGCWGREGTGEAARWVLWV